jgi:hypothetical protein
MLVTQWRNVRMLQQSYSHSVMEMSLWKLYDNRTVLFSVYSRCTWHWWMAQSVQWLDEARYLGDKSHQAQEDFLSPKYRSHLTGPRSLLFNGYQSALPAVYLARYEVDHLPSSSVEVRNECSYTSTPPVCLYNTENDNFTLPVPRQYCWYLRIYGIEWYVN